MPPEPHSPKRIGEPLWDEEGAEDPPRSKLLGVERSRHAGRVVASMRQCSGMSPEQHAPPADCHARYQAGDGKERHGDKCRLLDGPIRHR